MATYSCKDCVAPKRHPGCHASCSEYLAQKAKHDELKAAEDKRKKFKYGLTAKRRAIRFRQQKG